MTATPYPLAWPPGFPRTPPASRSKGPYKSALSTAINNLRRELTQLGGPRCGASLVLSSNVTLGEESPADPGVVAFFLWEEKQLAMPCDRWTRVEANVQAIALTIEAMRSMERHGAKAMITAMFSGFLALPPPADHVNWREVLGLSPFDLKRPPAELLEMVEAVHKRLSRKAHPDVPGGSVEWQARLNLAIDAARKELAPEY